MGKTIIIKGADFSNNSAGIAFKRVSALLYDDSDGEWNYQLYNGSPYPIPNKNGLYISRSTKTFKYAHQIDSLVTDKISIDGFSHFKIHSKFNLEADSVVAIGFYNADNVLIGFYGTTDTELPNKLGVVPTSDWCDVEGDILEGTAYMAVGCYKPRENEYKDFLITLS